MTILLFIIFIQHSTSQLTSTTGSNFFIDNDWILGQQYPFPVNLCIQTSADLNFLNLRSEFTYYACSQDKQQVTKYKWIQQDTDCSDLSTANESTTYPKKTVGTSCDLHHFECGGSDDYVTGNFYISFSKECKGLSVIDPSFSTSVATNISLTLFGGHFERSICVFAFYDLRDVWM
eukprot:526724_1